MQQVSGRYTSEIWNQYIGKGILITQDTHTLKRADTHKAQRIGNKWQTKIWTNQQINTTSKQAHVNKEPQKPKHKNVSKALMWNTYGNWDFTISFFIWSKDCLSNLSILEQIVLNFSGGTPHISNIPSNNFRWFNFTCTRNTNT